jgi:hypothetical protein
VKTTATVAFLLVLSAVGCAGTGRFRSISRMPKCAAAPAAPPAEWRKEEPEPKFAFMLPPSCSSDPDVPQFVHGGLRWRCGTVATDVVWGMWGPGSFGENQVQCRTAIAGVPALVSRVTDGGDVGYVVWYLTGYIHEPMLSAWGPAADEDVLRAITHSGRLLVERGPNR